MLRAAAVPVLALVACTDDVVIGPGAPVPTCTECGPGAVLDGRVFEGQFIDNIAANRNGTVALSTSNGLAALDATLTPIHSTPLDQNVFDLAVDDSDAITVVARGRVNDYNAPTSPLYSGAITHYGADFERAWSHSLEEFTYERIEAVSSAHVVVSTDANKIDGIRVSENYYLASLSATDGSVLRRDQLQMPKVAFAPDGTMILAGRFAGTLDLGGDAPPLDGGAGTAYVAAIDATSGRGRWITPLDSARGGYGHVWRVAVGPGGEIAVTWTPDSLSDEADSVTLLDAFGNVRWTQPGLLHSIHTDGVHVIGRDRAGVVQYSATGVDWHRDVECGWNGIVQVGNFELLAVVDDHLLAFVQCGGYGEEAPPTVRIGDVSFVNDGAAILKLAR